MPKHYRYDKSQLNTELKKFKRRRLALFVAIIIVVTSVVFGGWKIYGDLKAQDAINSKESNASSVAAMQVYRSPYFEFQDSGGSWELDKSSTNNKFAYYKHKDGLVEHELLIYVNSLPNNLYAAHGLPVKVNSENSFEVGSVSEHCHTVYGPNEAMRPHQVTMGGASFPCVPDTSQYSVYVAKVGGNQIINLKRASGETAQYVIFYRDQRYTPDDKTITGIIKSFRAI